MFPRPRLALPALLAVFALWGLAGCSHEVAPIGCFEDSECAGGEMCVDGECVAEQVTACQSDSECDGAAGERCLAGVCQATAGATGGSCDATSDCSLQSYCNTAVGQCQDLLAGWCREGAQCAGESPICSATSPDVPGRCVECLDDGDCVEGTCVNPGICQSTDDGGGGTPADNDNPVSPGDGTNDDGTSDDPCLENDWYDDGVCDDFCPEPDPDCTDDGGDTGDTGDFCADLGWYGDGFCDEDCPEPDPDCTGGGGGGGGGGGECVAMGDCWDAGYSIDYTCSDQGSCVCDDAWMESICDGDYDPVACECGGGGGGGDTGLAENESCVSSGQVLECGTGLECIYVSDGGGTPSYGGCKRVCSSSAECGGEECALGFLASGDGICGTPQTDGESGCGFWEKSGTFCYDPSAPAEADSAFLECLNGTCGFVCDYVGNDGSPFTCPSSGQCGADYQSYDGFGVDLAVCQ